MFIQLHKNPKINIQTWILLFGFLLLVIKFTAYFLTGSNTILSDALESIVNIVAGCLGLYSLYLSAKPRDEDHPYGHGKIEFISSSIEGTMIIIAGVLIIYKSIYSIIHPQIINDLGVGIILIAFSGFVNYIMGYIAVKTGKKSHSLALEASGEHLKTDAYSTIGILLGLLVIFITKLVVLDSIIAIIVGLFVIFNGYKIVKKSLAGIMDEADFRLNQQVIDHINQHRKPDWIDVHNFRVIKYGEIIHIDCHMTMPWYYTLQEAHDNMKGFEDCLNTSIPNPVETFIHIDPCIESSCSICEILDCSVRKSPFIAKVEWKMENIIKNQKHS